VPLLAGDTIPCAWTEATRCTVKLRPLGSSDFFVVSSGNVGKLMRSASGRCCRRQAPRRTAKRREPQGQREALPARVALRFALAHRGPSAPAFSPHSSPPYPSSSPPGTVVVAGARIVARTPTAGRGWPRRRRGSIYGLATPGDGGFRKVAMPSVVFRAAGVPASWDVNPLDEKSQCPQWSFVLQGRPS